MIRRMWQKNMVRFVPANPFLFDVDKKLVFHGKINDALEPNSKPSYNTMEENINRLLKGLNIEKDFDPSIGCSIKWK